MNIVVLSGHVGRDPEIRTTKSDKTVANFSLAENYRGETVWHKIVCWDKQADLVAQYVGKGSKVTVQGRLVYRDWEDRDGNKRQSTEIVAVSVDFGSLKEPESPTEDQAASDVPF